MAERECALIAFIFLIPIVAALSTPIIIQTEPYRNVTVNVINAISGDALSSIEVESGTSGKVSTNFTSDYNNYIVLAIIVRDNGKIVSFDNFGNYTPGIQIYIDLTAKSNVSIENSSSTNSSANRTNDTLTGSTVQAGNTTTQNETSQESESKNKDKSFPKIVIYIAGIVVLAGILFFFAFKVVPIIKNLMAEKGYGDYSPVEYVENKNLEKELEKAKKKLKEIQDRMDYITNRKNRLQEAEKKFEEARKELERLKGGKI